MSLMLLVDNIWLILLATVFGLVLLKLSLDKTKHDRCKRCTSSHRRTSLASTIQVDRVMLEKHVGMRQNVVNAVLFFDKGDAPLREELVAAMKKLATRFERMRKRPRMTPGDERCEWEPIENLDAAIESAVSEDAVEFSDGDTSLEYKILQKVEKYKAEILPLDPAWRVVILSPSAVLVRIDHCVGDGLTLVTLLKEIGSRTNDNRPLELSDLSPLLRRFTALGDWRVSLLPLKLLWPPCLWRAFSLLVAGPSGPEEPPNPLRPLPRKVVEAIPAESYGTVYFPSVPLSLLKQLARAAGTGTTINDVVLFCFGDAVKEYFSQIGSAETFESVRLLLPISNPIRPSLYGDEYEGLCNHMTPVVVPLNLSDAIRERPQESLEEIKEFMEKVKKSNTPLLMNTMNTLLDRFIPINKVYTVSEAAFKRISCVYSNVPGPTTSVSISNRRLRKMHVVMPHPTSIFQMLSYDGRVFFNITLDTRTAHKSWLLRDAFVGAIRNFADNFGVSSDSSVRSQIDELAHSDEWGGRGIVFTCGNEQSS